VSNCCAILPSGDPHLAKQRCPHCGHVHFFILVRDRGFFYVIRLKELLQKGRIQSAMDATRTYSGSVATDFGSSLKLRKEPALPAACCHHNFGRRQTR
jgi:hypothetical protein